MSKAARLDDANKSPFGFLDFALFGKWYGITQKKNAIFGAQRPVPSRKPPPDGMQASEVKGL
jgi:hypothetical protein